MKMELAAAINITRRLTAEIERLTAERDEWKERCEAERRDHEATIRNSEYLLREP
jgi:hypothetical protein